MRKVEDGSVLSIRERVSGGDPFGMLHNPTLRASVIKMTYQRWREHGKDEDLRLCREMVANEASLADDGYGDARKHLDPEIVGV